VPWAGRQDTDHCLAIDDIEDHYPVVSPTCIEPGTVTGRGCPVKLWIDPVPGHGDAFQPHQPAIAGGGGMC
jgi:hypothetical protein